MTVQPIKVRPAVEQDLPTLQAIAPRAHEGIAHQVLAAQSAGEAVFAVAERGGAVVGTGVLDLRESELLPQVKLLHVVPEARRGGVGKALTAFLEDAARERGFEACHMAVDPDNAQAIPMVVSLDYSPTGDHHFVDTPADDQAAETFQQGAHYAVYRKSLTMR